MGLNIPDVKHIIHYGVLGEVGPYVQEIGKGGRDKRTCRASRHYKLYHLPHCDKDMRDYGKAKTCRRKILVKYFKNNAVTVNPKHGCCDACRNVNV